MYFLFYRPVKRVKVPAVYYNVASVGVRASRTRAEKYNFLGKCLCLLYSGIGFVGGKAGIME